MAQSDIEFILRFLVDNSSKQQAAAAIKELEAVGIRFNEKAQRFQEIKSVTGGTSFVSGEKVKLSLEELQVEKQVSAEKIRQAQIEAELVQLGTVNLETGRLIAEWAAALDISLEEAATAMAGMTSMGGRSQRALLQDADAYLATVGDTQGILQDSSRTTRQIAGNTREMSRNVGNMRDGFAGFLLAMTGMTMQRAGRALLAPIGNYLKFAGMADQTSKEWLQSQVAVEQSMARIGRAMAASILPLMERFADLMEDVAAFAEKHPQAMAALTMGAGITVAVGGLLMAVGQMWAGIFAIKTFAATIGLTGAGAAAGAAGGAAVGGAAAGGAVAGGAAVAGGLTIGAIVAAVVPAAVLALAGTILGTSIYEKNKAPDQPGGAAGMFSEAGKSLGQILTTAAIGAGILAEEVFGADDATRKWGEAVGRFLGVIDGADKKTEDAANEILSEQAANTYVEYLRNEQQIAEDYAKQRVEMERTYEEQRNETIADYGKRRVEMEADYERQRSQVITDALKDMARAAQDFNLDAARALRDYNQKEAEATSNYYKQRNEIIANYNEGSKEEEEKYQQQIIKIQRDYKKQLRRLEEDHGARVDELIAQRDALGLVAEKRRYDREKRQLAEDTQDRIKEIRQQQKQEAIAKRQDFEKQLAELDANFAAERAKRKADFEQEQADNLAEFQLEQARRQQDFQDKLKEMDAQHAIEMARFDADHRDKLNKMQMQHNQEMAMMQRNFNDEKQRRDYNIKLQMQSLLKIEQDGYASMLAAARQYVTDLQAEAAKLKSGSTTPTTGTRQAGGYVTAGLWQLHDNEYVLSAATTKKLESVMGRKISQPSLLASLASRRGSSGKVIGQLNLYQRIDFHGALTAAEHEKFRKVARQEATNGVLEAFGEL